MSDDQHWMAIEHVTPSSPGETFDVMIRHTNLHPARRTIHQCQQLLGLSTDGKIAAVVRHHTIELWDTVNSKLIKKAPFNHARVDAATFAPDGKRLAISDAGSLILWAWENDTHDRLKLESRVESLAFSPDGRFLAEGPTKNRHVRLHDLNTNLVVQTFSAGHDLSVPHLAFTQGGRVLIACDNTMTKGQSNPIARPRIFLWDTADGSLAHQLTVFGPSAIFRRFPERTPPGRSSRWSRWNEAYGLETGREDGGTESWSSAAHGLQAALKERALLAFPKQRIEKRNRQPCFGT